MSIKIVDPFAIRNQLTYGNDRIFGSVLFKDNTIARNVWVKFFNQRDNSLLSAVLSDNDGIYHFENIDLKNNKFFITAHDPTGQHNAVIADNIGGENVVD